MSRGRHLKLVYIIKEKEKVKQKKRFLNQLNKYRVVGSVNGDDH
jgi:hypothetical protein